MAVHIPMPKLNETGENAIIEQILVQVGDAVEEGQAVIEVEMEKAVVEIESPHAGTVSGIHVAKGDEIAVGTVLIELE